jgi:hypothetical protein
MGKIINFILYYFLLLLNINSVNTLILSNMIINNKNNKNNIINLRNNNILMRENMCPEYLSKFTNLLDDNQSELIVKSTTNFLTKVDGVGGYILHTNDVIINYLLNNNFLNMETKKSLILKLIEFSQMGDATGHQILQLYYDLVSCLL